jgi:type II secretory pathway pseudopilin PulG
MKPPNRKRLRGFSLVETAIAIGLFGMMVPPVLMVVTSATGQATTALRHDALSSMRTYLTLNLEDPDWPNRETGDGPWHHELTFDRDGSPLPAIETQSGRAAVKAVLHATPAPHLKDIGLEQIRVEFRHVRSDRVLSTASLQRHRPL